MFAGIRGGYLGTSIVTISVLYLTLGGPSGWRRKMAAAGFTFPDGE